MYEHVKKGLGWLKYNDDEWEICVDLMMVNCLMGQHGGYIKYPCFLCLWDDRAKQQHLLQKKWRPTLTANIGEPDVIHESLIAREKMMFAPLHIIKLGLMKQFMKALGKNGKCMEFISSAIPHLSTEQI